MSLCGPAAMLLYYDITGDTSDHDDWHSYEHLHERLSIPGFLRATRWMTQHSGPRYFILYEVSGLEVAESPDYLERLNNPTAWTQSMMERFSGMVRGFGEVVASAGFGLGDQLFSMRFKPVAGCEQTLVDRLREEVLPKAASRKGMASLHCFSPAPPPPMTKEQSLRGSDKALTWVLLASAYDGDALERVVSEHVEPRNFEDFLHPRSVEYATYRLHFTATAMEAALADASPLLDPDLLNSKGPRL